MKDIDALYVSPCSDDSTAAGSEAAPAAKEAELSLAVAGIPCSSLGDICTVP